ncbi:hypothetical protein P22_1746 [Propionispora sp. 2/2-37]|uniref:L-aspartate oxidase n=1 Tax=Propionispora sp. 2/2-37 TaxID=1677858 RepID=UPI0006C31AA6|nr:L-aspartate oxidase [Propionispora sp. 2/2-37]CUH95670.1 hypothetical protein P22_1746 [Propionispora sp. 2/2-37]
MKGREYSNGMLPAGQYPKSRRYDVIIVGMGVAGLTVALSLDKKLRIALVSKNSLDESSTYKAQGGMAVAAGTDDSAAQHAADTLHVGKGLCSKESVAVLTREAPAALDFLQTMGTRFCKSEQGLELAREGGHSRKRVVHHYDFTGRHIAEVLARQTAGRSNIECWEDTFLIDILTNAQGCCGCLVKKKKQTLQLLAPAVVIAAGGYSGIFGRSTNSVAANGDGIAAAYRAGAVITDMEFVQFHPTAVTLPTGKVFLVSEALRGEGALLVNAAGERFMPNYHESAELAPRDEVSRAMLAELERQQGGCLYLDARALGQDYLMERFQAIYAELAEHGYFMEKQLIPVLPTAHYTIGGIKTDLWGQSSIPHLYACGESAATGVHGANRLASNSLLEGVVFGRRVAAHIHDNSRNPLQTADFSAAERRKRHSLPPVALLRKKMDVTAGVVRQGRELKDMTEWLHQQQEANRQEEGQPDFSADNAYLLAGLLVEAALLRRESRGGHYRADYPVQNDRDFKKHSIHVWGKKVSLQ